jgi:flagellar biosynthesis protein FlhG
MTTPARTQHDTAAPARIVAITSGKGGVGKTFLSANLAAALAKRGERVLVLDADLGLANLDVVLNLHPKTTLHDVFTGAKTLDEAILPAPGGFSVLLAGSGLVEYSRLTPEVREKLLEVIQAVRPRFDRVLLDTGAGISDIVLYTISLADDVLVVATPEPTSMTDAYATTKVLATRFAREEVHVVVNQTQRAGEGQAVFQHLRTVLDKFVRTESGEPVKLRYVGDVPGDASVKDAVQRRQLLLETYPGSEPAKAVTTLAAKLPAR